MANPSDAIDTTLPVQGNPTTSSVRDNFAATKSAIAQLELTAGVGPPGEAATLTVGTTTTTAAGTNANVTQTGTAQARTFNFSIPRGTAATIAVGSVTTGNAGTNATVTNSGSNEAATLNFTIPRGDAGTGGAGITETQAVDAVRQGNPQFSESPATTAATWPTTNAATTAPILGTGWSGGASATAAATHATGNSESLAYPISIAANDYYQITFTGSANAPYPLNAQIFTLYFRNGATTTTGQQSIKPITYYASSLTINVQATASFTHFVVVPVSNWAGNFTLSRIARGTSFNSQTLRIKDFAVTSRSNTLVLGNGGRLLSQSDGNSVALGHDAMLLNSLGSFNVAIGPQAMRENVSGGTNVAIGYQAMQQGISVSSSVMIGPNAGRELVSGSDNTFIGSAAGSHKRAGEYNVYVGQYAGYSQYPSIGEYNIGIGYYSFGYNFRTGGYNIGLGYYAGMNLRNGSNNIAIGAHCLGYGGPPPEGDFDGNIAIGERALQYHTTGNFNVVIGYQAIQGYDFRDLEKTDLVIIGHGANPSMANPAENQIVIGANALGYGNNSITLGDDEITAVHCNVTSFTALSDPRIKEDVQPANLDLCVDAVKALPVARYKYKDFVGYKLDKHVTGFLADDVAKVFPKAVGAVDRSFRVGRKKNVQVRVGDPQSEQRDEWPSHQETQEVEETETITNIKTITMDQALPTLWGAVQRLIEKNEELERELKELKAK